MNRACAVAFALVLACAGFAAADRKSAADSLIKDGAFDLSTEGPSAEYSKNRRTGFFSVITEDGSWNRCGKLSVGKGHKGKHGKTTHYARIMVGCGECHGHSIRPFAYPLRSDLRGRIQPEYHNSDDMHLELQCISIGDCAFAGMPGELLAEPGL